MCGLQDRRRSSSPAARQCSFFEWDDSLALPAVDLLPPSPAAPPMAMSTAPDTTRGRRVSLFDELVQFLARLFLQLLWPALVVVLASLAVSAACSATLPTANGSGASFSWPEPTTSAMVPYAHSLGVPTSLGWSPSIGVHLYLQCQ